MNGTSVHQAIQDYRVELRSLGRAPGTIRVYMGFLTRFAATCDEITRESSRERTKHCAVSAVDAKRVSQFFADIRTDNARNGALVALRGFLRWANRADLIAPAAAAKAVGDRKLKKFNRKPKYYIPASDFPRALEIAGERHPKERAALALMLYTLCRQSEIQAMRLRDIHWERNRASVWRQKRQRYTESPVGPDLVAELGTWLRWYASHVGYETPEAMTADHPDWYLVPCHGFRPGGHPGRFDGSGEIWLRPESPTGDLKTVVKRVLTGLGVTETTQGLAVAHKGEGGHTIRRSGARALFFALGRTQEALDAVSAMLDHEDTRMTKHYIGYDYAHERLSDHVLKGDMYGVQQSSPEGARIIPFAARRARVLARQS